MAFLTISSVTWKFIEYSPKSESAILSSSAVKISEACSRISVSSVKLFLQSGFDFTWAF
jgi:hypothetical protein